MKASLFITCICDSFYPEVGKSVVRILEKNNVQIYFPPGQVCCGQPAFNTGYWEDAKEVAKGYECGLTLANYNDLKEGDILEAYIVKEKPRD